MKKLYLVILACFYFSGFVLSQADNNNLLSIHGIVKTARNQSIPRATVAVKGASTVAETDSSGYFTINAKKRDTLIVMANGYESVMSSVANNEMIVIKLEKMQESAQVNNELIKQQTISNIFQDFSKGQTGGTYNGSSLPVYRKAEDQVGSRYYFNEWMKGEVITDNGSVVNDDALWFNYDKISKVLLLSKDRNFMIEVDKDKVESFTLRDENNIDKIFKKIPQINNSDYFIKLTGADGKYELYKSVKTTLERNNYHNVGMIETGHNYDLYSDEFKYYVFNPATKSYLPFEASRKSILTVFKDDAKAKKYLREDDDTIDEFYLIRMINYMNH